MTGAAIFPSLRFNRFLEFLRLELRPTPKRWRATLRITLACVAASFPVMAFHLHVSLLVMILMFLITREDTTTTLFGTMLGVIGITIGSGILLLTYLCFADLTWLRVLLVPTFIALGLFVNRVLTLGPLGSVIGLPLAIGMIVPDVLPSSEFLTRFPFYFWWAAVLGLSVNLSVQYLLNPERAQSVLVRGLVLRLDAVHDSLLGLLDEEPDRAPHSLAALALEGAAEQLHLLKLASAAEPFLKRHYAAVAAQVILVDRLVTAAGVLEERRGRAPDDAIEARLRRVASAVATWRQALLERRWPHLEPPDPRAQASGGPPMLLEMERVLDLVSKSPNAESLPAELKVLPKSSPVVSDAFSNPAHIHFAIKGALAAFICYLIFTLTAYQGIYTSVITCIVCSLSTIGASVQKGVLRLAGSAVGGVLGVVTLTCIFPYVDSIGGFWFPFAAVTGLAAYVTLGGPALSYGGYQIGLAFYKCVLQSYGPYTELRVVRDRLIGILLGLAVFGLINNWLWPVKALESVHAKLASALQTLAKLVSLPDDAKDPGPRLAQAYELRLQAYQAFRSVNELLESSKFEPGENVRRKLEELSSKAQRLLLYFLAVIQHRPAVRPDAVPEPLRVASSRFRTTLADELQTLAARADGQVDRPGQDLKSALAELEQSVAASKDPMANVEVAVQVHGRLGLYQEAARILAQMAQLQAELKATATLV
jgi:multidrug resistance protein MdtO